MIDALRRWLGRPRPQRVSVEPGGAIAAAGELSARVSVNPDATLDEKVDFLLRRDQDVQGHLEQHARQLRDLPKQWNADIAAASTELRTEHADALRELRESHLTARLLGVLLLVVGIALATWGNLA
jgi:hypothetical protein